MDDYLDFETYLSLSPEKFIIKVNTETKKNLYEKELILSSNSKHVDLEKLELFLNENIFKIEKILNGFIKKIIMIIDSDDFFSVDISIKKNNYGNILSLKTLNYLLYDLKDYCKESTY